MNSNKMKKRLSLILTAVLIVSVGFAIYQSAKERLENKIRTELEETEKVSVENIEAIVEKKARSTNNSSLSILNTKKTQINKTEEKEPKNLPLKGYFEGKLSDNTTLHVVGVYEGQNASGVDDPPWWKNCQGIDPEDRQAMMACHQKYAGIRKQKTVKVHLVYTKTPVVMALMAYEPVQWSIDMAKGVQLEGVILAGYHAQDLIGVPTDTRAIAFNHDTPECQECIRGDGYFYAYKKDKGFKKAAIKLFQVTGRQISSFQGAYKSNYFSINNNID